MISLPHSVRVFLHAPATDLRKGFDALSGLVTTAFGQDPPPATYSCLSIGAVIESRSSTGIVTGWPSGTNGSNPRARSSSQRLPMVPCRSK